MKPIDDEGMAPAPQILFPGDAHPSGGFVYGVRVGPLESDEQREQRAGFERLQSSLDQLVAVWVLVTGKTPSQATVMELMLWANEQRLNPTRVDR